MRRPRLDVLGVVLAALVTLGVLAVVGGREPAPVSVELPGRLPTPTLTPTATPGWEAELEWATPELPALPGLPNVEKLKAEVTGGKKGDPVPFQVVSCPHEAVRIDAVTKSGRPGWWDISGIASIPGLWYWRVELGSGGQGWVMLHQGSTPAVLVEFYTRTVPEGVYQVRLTAVDQTGNYPEPCVIEVQVRDR